MKMAEKSEWEFYLPGNGDSRDLVPNTRKISNAIGNFLQQSLLISANPVQLDPDDYKIDTHMTTSEKLQNWREKKQCTIFDDYETYMKHRVVSVLVKKLSTKNAYVIEYIPTEKYPNGKQPENTIKVVESSFLGLTTNDYVQVCYDREVPAELVGKQMFTYAAAKELKLINNLPYDISVFKKAYVNAWLEDKKPAFSWSIRIDNRTGEISSSGVGNQALFLLWDGGWVLCDEISMKPANLPEDVAMSLRLVSEVNYDI